MSVGPIVPGILPIAKLALKNCENLLSPGWAHSSRHFARRKTRSENASKAQANAPSDEL